MGTSLVFAERVVNALREMRGREKKEAKYPDTLGKEVQREGGRE